MDAEVYRGALFVSSESAPVTGCCTARGGTGRQGYSKMFGPTVLSDSPVTDPTRQKGVPAVPQVKPLTKKALKRIKASQQRMESIVANAESFPVPQETKLRRTRRKKTAKDNEPLATPQSRAKILAELRSRKQKSLDNPITPNTVQSAGQ